VAPAGEPVIDPGELADVVVEVRHLRATGRGSRVSRVKAPSFGTADVPGG
jgi:hypothetical protein